MGNLLKKFTPEKSGKKKWLLILFLVAAIGVGGFFLIRYFFFRTPDLEEGFQVWQEVTASEDFRSLDRELYTGDEEDNFMGKLMFYFTGEADTFNRTYIGIMEQYQHPAYPDDGGLTLRVQGVADNLRYVRNRLELASYAYTCFGDYADYIAKNLLFLPNENVAAELKIMIAQRSAVLSAQKELVEYMEAVRRGGFIPISSGELADINVFPEMLSEVNSRYFAPVATLFIHYVEEIIIFANLANDTILAGCDTLGAMSYRNSLYNVGLTLLQEMLQSDRELPETYTKYFEGMYGEGARFLNRMYLIGDQTMGWNGTYTYFNQKFLQNLTSDEDMILKYQDTVAKNFKITNIKQSGFNGFLPDSSVTLVGVETSMKKIVEGLRSINVKELCFYSFEIATELATSELPVTVASDYLKTLSQSQQVMVKTIFTLLFGVEV